MVYEFNELLMEIIFDSSLIFPHCISNGSANAHLFYSFRWQAISIQPKYEEKKRSFPRRWEQQKIWLNRFSRINRTHYTISNRTKPNNYNKNFADVREHSLILWKKATLTWYRNLKSNWNLRVNGFHPICGSILKDESSEEAAGPFLRL